MRKVVSEYPSTEDELLRQIKDTYTGEAQTQSHSPASYCGQDNGDLDAPISFAQVYAATQVFRKNMESGPDRITNAMLKNLSDSAIQQLTNLSNDTVWKPHGRLPSKLKAASAILIPKPGKPRELV